MNQVVAIQDKYQNIHVAVVYGELFHEQVQIGDTIEASSTGTPEITGKFVGCIDVKHWHCPFHLEDVTLEVKWWFKGVALHHPCYVNESDNGWRAYEYNDQTLEYMRDHSSMYDGVEYFASYEDAVEFTQK